MEKPGHLQRMFNTVPARYDSLNRLMTLGLDQRWRRQAAQQLLADKPKRVLDIGSGTGDLSLLLARLAPDLNVIAADFSRPMLDLLLRRAGTEGVADRIESVEADAADLPFRDAAFDAVGTAFAFRNLIWKNPNRDQHLLEIFRVIRDGGRFVAVETSQPNSSTWRSGFHLWMRAVAGPLGGLISGQKAAYRYLATSAINFYTPQKIKDMLLATGFSRVKQTQLFGGVACVHTAYR